MIEKLSIWENQEGKEASFSFNHIKHVCYLAIVVELKNNQEAIIDGNEINGKIPWRMNILLF